MATVVQRFSEGAYIITADGEEIPIYEGMVLEDGDIIVGDVATIEDADAVDPGSDVTTIPADEIAALQQLILEGADPTQVGERTAAGAPAAGGPGATDGGGSSFVALDRAGNEVDPTAGYPTGTFTSAFETPQEEPPAVLDETPLTETPVEPEPPVVEPEPPVEPEPVLPTVTVDLEVDPGEELLKGEYTDATRIVVKLTGSDGSELEFEAVLNDDGTWTVDLGDTEFDPDVEYTAEATAYNDDGEAKAEDVDSYESPVTPPPPPPEPEEPTVEVTKEYKTETRTDVTTETVVGDEYEVDRSTDTVVTEEEQEDGTLKTTTTTTTINYNQETNTITTTVTTTEYYEREITTTTYPDGTKDVVTSDWELVGTQTNTDESTDTVETPRQEILVDVQEELIPPPGPENLIPVAEDDIFNITEDDVLEASVTANDKEIGDGAHHYELVGESIPGLVFREDGTFEYTPTDEDGDQTVTFDYYIVDEDGDRDIATVTLNITDVLDPEPPVEPPAPPSYADTWFISQGGNHPGTPDPTGVDYEMVTGATGRMSGDMELVISNKGLGDYKVQEGDSVTFTFDLVHTDAVYGEDYTLDIVSKAPQWDVGTWEVKDGVLTVNMDYNGDKDFNLAGNTFAIKVVSTIDDGHANVGFDMTGVTHHDVSAVADVNMGQWETNDDVVIGLNSSSDFIPPTNDLPVDY